MAEACLQWTEETSEVCVESADEGYRECTRKRDEGYRTCDDWGIFSFVCVAWTWVSNIVCVAWTWVSKWVCVAWKEVVQVVCVLWIYLITLPERIWDAIVLALTAIVEAVLPIFNPLAAQEFDECEARFFARICSAAYTTPGVPPRPGQVAVADIVDDELRACGYQDLETITFYEAADINYDTQVYVFFDPAYGGDGRLIVAFRGTEFDRKPVEDLILTDLNAPMTPIDVWHGAPSVHTGFLLAHKAVETRVMLTLAQQLERRGAIPVHFTGHSLGGGIATVAAFAARLVWLRDDASDYALRTFGSPRVGNREFVRVLRHKVPDIVRFVSAQAIGAETRDPVTQVPFKGWGYCHVFPRVVLFDDGSFVLTKYMDLAEMNPIQPGELEVAVANLATALQYHDIAVSDTSYETKLDNLCTCTGYRGASVGEGEAS